MRDVDTLISETYKTHSAKLLAVLTRLFGTHNLELAEDVLQDAFNKAMIDWQNKLPDQPAAWITQTAKHQAIDVIRANKVKMKFSEDLSQHLESEWSLGHTIEQEFEESKIKDDQLRMIFMCCHEDIKPEHRIPFILKTLCGFSIPAVARALVLPLETVKKRLLRTRQKLSEYKFEFPRDEQIIPMMDTVHTVIYLLFNEGFHSSDEKQAMNLMFCQEAIGLTSILTDEPRIVNQDTLGLLALMHFHIARIDSRVDHEGFNIPIDRQDRSLWQAPYINTAKQILKVADKLKPGAPGRFYIEALIAQEHCIASNFAQTNWPKIETYYTELVRITRSPIAELNHAIAIAYTGKITRAIKQVKSLQNHKTLKSSHLPLSTLAHLYAMQGNAKQAYEYAEQSKTTGGTPIENQLMMQQLERHLKKA